MPKFRFSSHGRLQDWIAVENGYFDQEGLDYEFNVRAFENVAQDIAGNGEHDIRVGAYELYLSGGRGKKDMSCACHCAVNQAAASEAGQHVGSCVLGASQRHLHARGLAGPPSRRSSDVIIGRPTSVANASGLGPSLADHGQA